ncbi:MAG: outer membrane lipoprotein carrier protein LolA [Chitinophagales bacterium]
MLRQCFLFLFLIGSLPSIAQYAGYIPLGESGAFKTSFAAAAQKTNSIRSNFIQEKSLSMLEEKIISKGKFWFKKENRVRMEYQEPFQYLLVINNSQVLVRDGEKENKISARSNKIFGEINQIMIDCVQGTVLSNPGFSVRIFYGNQSYFIELSPISKIMKELFKNVIVHVGQTDYSAFRIELNEINGDKTLIRFTNKELNVEIPDSLFAVH